MIKIDNDEAKEYEELDKENQEQLKKLSKEFQAKNLEKKKMHEELIRKLSTILQI